MTINYPRTLWSSISDRWGVPVRSTDWSLVSINELIGKSITIDEMFGLPVETHNFPISIVKEEDFMKCKIKKVVFNDPATIVFWTDDTKTVVKCGKDETYDPEKGLAMAICKKYFGNEGNYYNEFRKWLPKTDKNED